MSLTPGATLGSYEVLGSLGTGGMGEVYRARDLKLKREVAIKILPEGFSRDSERLSRFQREAEVLASLNHPNIAAIHDLSEANGLRFLVLELVEGGTLADRIRSGAISLEETARIGKQIAEALEAAHAKGIVHRDLKPANVKVTPDGTVKVLDFGLAKVLDPQQRPDNISNSPTVMSGTLSGVILGTAAYMSPEQARGQALDAQSDIWSFGCVLYEMLTGKQAFDGETLTDVLGGIVRGEPDWSALPSDTPSLVRLLLRQCLQKQRNLRLRHIGDARIQIDAALGGSYVDDLASSSVSRKRRRLWVAAVASLLLLALGMSPFVVGYFRLASKEAGTIRFHISPPEKASFNSAGGTNAPYVTISPDGRQVAFIAATEGVGNRIWIRPLDSLEARPLSGTEGVAAYPPFWSPDGRFIAFGQQGKLKKIEVAGGPAQALCDVAQLRSGTWSRDGVIIFDAGAAGPLMRVTSAGGKPEPATALDASRQEQSHAWPYFLPDGDHFLFLGLSASLENDGIFVGSLSSKETKFLIPARSRLAYDYGGFLLFVRDRSLMAQSFDAEKLTLSGEPFPIAEQVRYNPLRGAEGQASLAVSDNGVLAYRAGGDEGIVKLTWVDRGGRVLGTIGPVSSYRNPELSPDDKNIAVQRTDLQAANEDIGTIDVLRGATTRVTTDPAVDQFPVWSPDGKQILFQRDGLYVKPSSGYGAEELLLKAEAQPWDWSADNRFIIYSPNPLELWALPLFGDRKPFLFLKSEFRKIQAQFSPDGRWVAFQSNESGRAEVYVHSFPNPSTRIIVSTEGGSGPRWSGTGNEIFYVTNRVLMSVKMQKTGTTLEPSPPTPLFEMPVLGGGGVGPLRQSYDVTQDGQRFLLNAVDSEGPADTPLTVVINWAAGLKK